MATINGTGSNDTLTGTSSADLINAFGGNDSIFGGGGSDTVFAGTGDDTVDGGANNDSLLGEDGNDSLIGGTGSDSLFGGNNNDTLIGGTGSDSLDGGAGFDWADYSTSGSAVSINLATNANSGGDAAGDTLTAIEAVLGSAFNDTMVGSAADESLVGGAGNDRLDGGGGNDTLVGGTGSDTLIGGSGTDVASYATSAAAVAINLSANINTGGDAAGDSITGVEAVVGSAFNDTLIGSNTADSLDGGAGADSLAGLGGNDTIFGGAGNDTVVGGFGADSIDAGIGNDVVSGGAGADNILGGDGLDTITAGDSADTVDGGIGDDSIDGGSGADSLSGGTGNDSILGGGGNDTVIGGDGNDTIHGDYAATAVSASESLNWNLAGTDETSIANGFTQNTGQMNVQVSFLSSPLSPTITVETTDTAFIGVGEPMSATSNLSLGGTGVGVSSTTYIDFAATASSGLTDAVSNVQFRINDIDAGAGSWRDIVTVNAYDADGNLVPVTITLSGNDSVSGNTITGATTSDTQSSALGSALIAIAGPVARIEIIYANGDVATQALWISDVHFDTIVQVAGNDSIDGGIGDDSIFGGAGNDTLLGGVGLDTIDGGTEADSIDGGDGNDSLLGGTGVFADTIFGGLGNDTIRGDDGNDSIFGGAGTDSLDGGLGADSIDGGTEADSIDGGDGNDSIWGGTGIFADTIFGGLGNDTIRGDDGDDSIFGGAGTDSLDGGLGADSIDGGTEADSIDGGDGNDSIWGGTGVFADTIFGGLGNDTVLGGDGNDSIAGGSGDDSLLGEAGNDTIFGDAGNDTVNGGLGADLLNGGGNNDLFTGLTAGDVVDGSEDVGNTDIDTLDLFGSGWTKALTNIIFDPMNPENGTVEFLDNLGAVIGTMSFSNIENIVPCFTPGILIETDRGPVPVESVKVGDRVLTRDSGYRPVRWTGRRDLGTADLIVKPALVPVVIRRGALGPDMPACDMMVSPQHRMLLTGARAELVAGETEVLAAALHLVGQPGIERAAGLEPVSYVHILFDRHEIVRSDGCWSESFQPGAATLDGMDDAQRDEILSLFPELGTEAGRETYASARLSLKAHEVRAILAA